MEAREWLKSSTSGSTPDFLSWRPLLPGTPVASPHLSRSANRVFVTCHLLPLCRSADKGPGEITESISAASVRQCLLSMSSERPRQTALPDDGHRGLAGSRPGRMRLPQAPEESMSPLLGSFRGWSPSLCIEEAHYPTSKSDQGLPDGLTGKESARNAGNTDDVGSIPGLGRSPGGGNGNSGILAWKIPWTEKPGELQPKRSLKSPARISN